MPESLRVEIPGEEICFPCIAVDASRHPIARLMRTSASDRNEMVYFPRTVGPDNTVIVKGNSFLTVETCPIGQIIEIVQFLVVVRHSFIVSTPV